MILRFVSKEGQFRLTVEPSTTFPDIIPQVAEKLPRNVDLSSIAVSNKPQGGDARKLVDLKGVTFEKVGLSYVVLISPLFIRKLTEHQAWRPAFSYFR